MELTIVCNDVPRDPIFLRQFLTSLSHATQRPTSILIPSTELFNDNMSDDNFDIATSCEAVQIIDTSIATSRWQAINIMVANAPSEYVAILEEDLWLSPNAFDDALDTAERNRYDIVSLPVKETMSPELVRVESQEAVIASDRLLNNPGHCLIASKAAFLRIRGYDERDSMTGVASVDLLERAGRVGLNIGRPDSNDSAAYHVSEICDYGNEHGLKSRGDCDRVSEQVDSDPSIYRNLVDWSVAPDLRPTLISVAIATRDRSDLISESLKTVLFQTFQEFEVVVVDDGSDEGDETEDVVRSLQDPRIRYVRQDPKGISAARNLAADIAHAPLTAVHDDDDLMLPNRLELGIAALTADVDASYGAWINFSNVTGEMRHFLTKEKFGPDLISYSGQGPGHATWTLPTDLIRSVRYDESLSSSVDHNLASRLAWQGVTWGHTKKFMFLRRVHSRQVSITDTSHQKAGHRLTVIGNRYLSTSGQRAEMKDRGKALPFPKISETADPSKHYSAYLPDHLVTRSISFTRSAIESQFAIDMPAQMLSVSQVRDLKSKRLLLDKATLDNVTFDDLIRLRKAGVTTWNLEGKLQPRSEDLPSPSTDDVSLTEVDGAEVNAARHAQASALTLLKNELINFGKKFPEGIALAEPDASPDFDVPLPEVMAAAEYSRVVVTAAEFGARSSWRIYGFSSRQQAVEAYRKTVIDDPASQLVFTSSLTPSELNALSTGRNHLVRNQSSTLEIDDSGLVG